MDIPDKNNSLNSMNQKKLYKIKGFINYLQIIEKLYQKGNLNINLLNILTDKIEEFYDLIRSQNIKLIDKNENEEINENSPDVKPIKNMVSTDIPEYTSVLFSDSSSQSLFLEI